jgi:4-amino-4-deoxy-L-arabinose transferase-like glycosyltransferase
VPPAPASTFPRAETAQRPPPLVRFAVAICIAVASSIVLITVEEPLLRITAGFFLLVIAPGLLVIDLIRPTDDLIECIVVQLAAGFVLSTLTLLVVAFLPGFMTVTRIIIAVAGLLLLLVIVNILTRPWRRQLQSSNHAHSDLFWLILALAVASVFRLPHLGYSELQDDEIDVANVARRIIVGDGAALLMDRRGPVQPVTTATAFVLTDASDEWIPRLPVALANLALIGTVFLLARTMFGVRTATIAGLLLALDGFILAYSRVVQMQSVLLWMMALTIYCFWCYQASTVTPSARRRYELLGALFFAFGLLAHYEMLGIGPVIAFLYIAAYRRLGWRLLHRHTLGALLLATVLVGVIYIPLALQPTFGDTLHYYTMDIAGQRIINNMSRYVQIALFYNSPYYFVVMTLLLMAAIALGIAHSLPGRTQTQTLAVIVALLGILLWIAAALAWALPYWAPMAFFSLLACLLILSPRLLLSWRATFLWFFVFFLAYLFLFTEVHIHYYAFVTPWAILAAATIDHLWAPLSRRLSGRWTTVGAWSALCLSLAFTAVSGYYLWLVFVRPIPKYALNFPAHQQPGYPSLDNTRHGEAFGFPHNSGWRTVGALYCAGMLRGAFETNELYLKARWYTRTVLNSENRPRYYLVAQTPHRVETEPFPPPLDESIYQLRSAITEQGAPILRIYEDKTVAPTPLPQEIAIEEFPADERCLSNPTDWVRAEGYQADDHFYQMASDLLADQTNPDQVLLLQDADQRGIIAYYDKTMLPYAPFPINRAEDSAANDAALIELAAVHPQINALFWAQQESDPQGLLEQWLNTNTYKIGEQWLGNVRLAQYDSSQTPPQVSTLTPLQFNLEDKITLEGAALRMQHRQEDVLLYLTLGWRATDRPSSRYKVFVHILGPDGAIVAQSDSEPAGGSSPTDAWRAGQPLVLDNHRIAATLDPSGDYSIAVGLYNPISGQRLPIFDPSGQRLADDRVVITSDMLLKSRTAPESP